jgi:hypothetical protein
MFHDNFAAYADGVSEAVRNAGPIDVDVVPERERITKSAPGEG